VNKATFDSPAPCDVALWIIRHRPGLTENALAEAMWGDRRRQTTAHLHVDLLEEQGLVERRRETRQVIIYPVNGRDRTSRDSQSDSVSHKWTII